MKIVKVLVVLVVLVLLAGGGFALWAKSEANAVMSRTYEAHTVDLPTPWPLSAAEIEELRAERAAALAPDAETGSEGDEAAGAAPVDVLADVDLDAIARERAVERGRHLIESRFACIECHGSDLGGGVMIDDSAIGRVLGPNLTAGQGGVVGEYSVADWERKVRHGVNPNGHSGLMPSQDFVGMSDQELSDIVTLIASVPPVDRPSVPVSLGPVGTVLVALGQLPLPAEQFADRTEHARVPPAAEPTATFGAHLATVCTGCHRADFSGGPIVGGDPSWGPAPNLTPGAGVLDAYDLASFDAVMRTGVRPNGTSVLAPMDVMPKYGAKMTDVEIAALFAYLQSRPPVPTAI
jgi:cytochrome c553